ncbi:MAG: hypothetical protein A3C35_01810 [Omnitrophica bacterium RIFCSPHIGHO2_02_FULL_46_11]|nr:MAG: hypothetical protein A3C35_01810 [Omnitrophica bacterium RIFCSPHIGHO2_02_FULL_46_11]OGW87501.1 MAG: hypothetical protein A3A81_03990 [Omnitrophica bacterium RIFCSPLOWO2_01_FULL_45_10b]
MPKEEIDPEDPMEMVGIELPGQSEAQLRDMTLSFAEEFVREGYDEEKLMSMFQNPFYQGPYLAWKQKGDDYVRAIIQEAIRMWRPQGGCHA